MYVSISTTLWHYILIYPIAQCRL